MITAKEAREISDNAHHDGGLTHVLHKIKEVAMTSSRELSIEEVKVSNTTYAKLIKLGFSISHLDFPYFKISW